MFAPTWTFGARIMSALCFDDKLCLRPKADIGEDEYNDYRDKPVLH